MLQRPNPSASDGCGKEECTMCSQPGGGKMCHKLNAVYKYECNLDGFSYIGETSRNFFSRNQEHEENYLNKRPESFINNHQAEMHGGQDPDFKYSVLKTFKDPLSRQICEGVQIRRFLVLDCFVLGFRGARFARDAGFEGRGRVDPKTIDPDKKQSRPCARRRRGLLGGGS